jgi:hypothetical protein
VERIDKRTVEAALDAGVRAASKSCATSSLPLSKNYGLRWVRFFVLSIVMGELLLCEK